MIRLVQGAAEQMHGPLYGVRRGRRRVGCGGWPASVAPRRPAGSVTPLQPSRVKTVRSELLAVLDHPDIPPHTNNSEWDIRSQVTGACVR